MAFGTTSHGELLCVMVGNKLEGMYCEEGNFAAALLNRLEIHTLIHTFVVGTVLLDIHVVLYSKLLDIGCDICIYIYIHIYPTYNYHVNILTLESIAESVHDGELVLIEDCEHITSIHPVPHSVPLVQYKTTTPPLKSSRYTHIVLFIYIGLMQTSICLIFTYCHMLLLFAWLFP